MRRHCYEDISIRRYAVAEMLLATPASLRQPLMPLRRRYAADMPCAFYDDAADDTLIFRYDI